jgi:two-component system copper resistance phosphate regulon response regulator CusR
MAKILVVEDEPSVADSIVEWLEAEGFDVQHVADGSEAMDYLRTLPFDVVVLDWNLPSMTGPQICRLYRSSGGTASILMLTGMSQTRDKIQGLDSGADDYLTKPFDVEELVVRVRALLRRPRTYVGTTLVIGPLQIDTKSRRASNDGVELDLKPLEFALLEYFMRHPDEVITAEALINNVWPSDTEASVDAVYTCINRLRKKLNNDSLIRNMRGVGYQLVSRG